MSQLETAGVLDMLERLAKGIVAVAGPNCEVVVHDFNDPEHSAVVVAGDISGRKPGAPVPDLDFIAAKLDGNTQDQLNYRIKMGAKTFQSSTIWIRDSEKNPIGAVCINMDYSPILKAQALLEEMTAAAKDTPSLIVQDTLSKNTDELIQHAVSAFMRQNKISDIEKMGQKTRRTLIGIIEKNGLFQLRGAVRCLADILKISRASIYNYRSGF